MVWALLLRFDNEKSYWGEVWDSSNNVCTDQWSGFSHFKQRPVIDSAPSFPLSAGYFGIRPRSPKVRDCGHGAGPGAATPGGGRLRGGAGAA